MLLLLLPLVATAELTNEACQEDTFLPRAHSPRRLPLYPVVTGRVIHHAAMSLRELSDESLTGQVSSPQGAQHEHGLFTMAQLLKLPTPSSRLLSRLLSYSSHLDAQPYYTSIQSQSRGSAAIRSLRSLPLSQYFFAFARRLPRRTVTYDQETFSQGRMGRASIGTIVRAS